MASTNLISINRASMLSTKDAEKDIDEE